MMCLFVRRVHGVTLAGLVFAGVGFSASGQCLPSGGIGLPHQGGAANDQFGFALAIFGERIVVGAPGDSDFGSISGSAYVVRRSGSTYVHEARLPASGLSTASFFGSAVAMTDTLAAVGASGHLGPGAVFVFRRNGTTWTQEQVLTSLDAGAGQGFGNAVSISGDRMLIGASSDASLGQNTGAAYIFRFNGSSWVQEARLTASNASVFAFYGISVSLSGTRALVSARDGNGTVNSSGTAYVYAFNGSAWVQEQRIDAPDAASSDAFGSSVWLDGDLALIGARADDEGGNNTGSAYFFRRSNGVWSLEAKVVNPDPAGSDLFGSSVALSGTLAVIGAPGDDTPATDTGAAYLYARIGSSWSLVQKILAPGGLASDNFGRVAISPDRMAVGANLDDDLGTSSGSASVFFVQPTLAITRQPSDTTTTAGQLTTLSVVAKGPLLTSYQWRRAGAPLVDGPALGGGSFIGTQTSALVLSAAAAPSAGAYDCVITSPCGETLTTNPVILSVDAAPCSGDADGSRSVNFLDITTVLANFGTVCP